MNLNKDKKNEREKIAHFIKEIHSFILELGKKKLKEKKEIDEEIFKRRQLLNELKKMTENSNCTNAMINELFDEMDNLNEQLYELRKESRRLLNESCGLDIIQNVGKGVHSVSLCIKGFKI